MLLWLHIFTWRERLVTLSFRLICHASWQWYCHRCPSGSTENLFQQELYLVRKTYELLGNDTPSKCKNFYGKSDMRRVILEKSMSAALVQAQEIMFRCEDAPENYRSSKPFKLKLDLKISWTIYSSPTFPKQYVYEWNISDDDMWHPWYPWWGLSESFN